MIQHTEGPQGADGARAAAAEAAGDNFYVTVRDGKRTGFLLGPYDTHTAALSNVQRGKDLAYAANARAPFYAYGTSSVDAVIKTVFGS